MRGELESAREHIRLFAAGDVAALSELYLPDAVMYAPEGWPEGSRFEGREEAMQQFTRAQEEWRSHSLRIEREASHEPWVVMGLVWEAEGRESGAPLEMHIVAAYRFEDGLIAEARHYWHFDEALAALGLPR
jgi:ketosteroid isomerase-like protein